MPTIFAVGSRKFLNQCFELFTGQHPGAQLLGLGLGHVDLGWCWLFRQGDEKLCQVDVLCQGIGVACLAVGQCAVHFGVGNTQAAIDFSLVQASDHQLVTQLVAKSSHTGAFGAQALVQLSDVHLILRSHIALGLVNGCKVNPYPRLPRELQLGAFTDHAFKHCGAKFSRSWHGDALLRPLLADLANLKAELGVGNRFGIHQSHNKVGLLRGLRVAKCAAKKEKGDSPRMQFHGGQSKLLKRLTVPPVSRRFW